MPEKSKKIQSQSFPNTALTAATISSGGLHDNIRVVRRECCCGEAGRGHRCRVRRKRKAAVSPVYFSLTC